MSELALLQRRPSADLVRSRAATGARELARAASHAGATAHAGARAGLRLVQTKLLVGAANDPYEREAERTADAVSAGQSTSLTSPLGLLRVAQRALGKGEDEKRDEERERRKDQGIKHVQRFLGGPESAPSYVGSGIESGILTRLGGGAPLDPGTRHALEPRFGYDFSAVRVHTDTSAAGAARALGARAFTVGQDVFFGAGQYQPSTSAGRHLIAHELTHTIQQTPSTARPSRLLKAPVMVQRWEGPIDKARRKVGEWLASDFPPWELITLVLGRDPIRDRPVNGTKRDWIRAGLKIIPGGEGMFNKLDQDGKIDELVQWWEGQLADLDLSWNGILALVRRAWDALELSDALHPWDTWNEKIKPIFMPTVDRVWNFIRNVFAKFLEVLRDVALHFVGDWAKKQKAYPLLTVILGKDPITKQKVPFSLKGLVFAVLDLVDGGAAIKESLERSHTIERAAAWFTTEFHAMNISLDSILGLFSRAWDAFHLRDLLHPIDLLERLWAIFKPPVVSILTFLGRVAKKLLELIFEGAMILAGPIGRRILGIVRRIGATFEKIVDNPVGFVRNLVNAIKRGFSQFGLHIWDHLRDGVVRWLVGALEGAGLTLPTVWDLRGILDLALQVLGITYAKVRVKLVRILGEPTVAMLERVFTFIKTLVTEGPAAAWREIVAAVGNLWEMVIGGIKGWAVTRIVTAAITQLATMFNPAGAIIQAVFAIYNTIAFFIERINQIADLVESVVDSVANIAEGKLTQAANYVERTMARTIPVILGFLARLLRLGDVSGQIKKVIEAIQQKVDSAIDKVLEWVVEQARRLIGSGEPGTTVPGAIPDTEFVDEESGEHHHISARIEGGQLVATISSVTQHLEDFLAEATKEPRFKTPAKVTQLATVRTAVTALENKLKSLKAVQGNAQQEPAAQQQVRDAEQAVAAALKALLTGVTMKEFDERYKLEGIIGTYSNMPKQTGDKMTPDHQPQASLVKLVADLEYDDPDTKTKRLLFANRRVRVIASGSHVDAGIAINLHHNRHKEGATYGAAVPSSVQSAIRNATRTPVTSLNKDQQLEARRQTVIGHVVARLADEVKEMRKVADNNDFYEDVVTEFGGKKKAQPLIDKLKKQIHAGEDRILVQDLQGWAS